MPISSSSAMHTDRFRWSWKRRLVLVYLVALAIAITSVDGDRSRDGRIHFSFVDSHPEDTTGMPVIVVLHGSPVASVSMMDMHESLLSEDGFRIITPDLPGFGGSTISIPDYSVKAHAAYLVQALDSLGIRQAHLLAYSMSGGVALQTARLEPEKVASIVMVSALGIQELELTGDYFLNHAVHALQLGGLWSLREGLPHFGWMDNTILGVSYARNFFDTDQRPLRSMLAEFRGPMQIIHGTDDFLVRYEVALEHYRLVPQSTLKTINSGGHGMVFQMPDSLASLITSFVRDVERGNAMTADRATLERILEADKPFDPSWIPPAAGFNLIVLFILIVAATLVSEDLACIGAGLLVARGTLTFASGFSAAFFGIVIGDVLLYALGRGLGRSIVRRGPFRWFLPEEKLLRGSEWFKRRGIKVIFTSRFVPGTRLPTYVAAGVLKAPFWSFLVYFLVASLLWTPIMVGLSSVLGNEILRYYDAFEAFAIWVLLGLIISIYASVHVAVPAFSHTGRRRLISKWSRITNWEFWPAYIFYIPVVGYVLLLAAKHRSLTVFTAANPAMPQGGFIGESKSDILDSLKRGTGSVASFATTQPGVDGASSVQMFMKEQGLTFPVVLKPDIGERGDGVVIAKSLSDVREYFRSPNGRTIVQEFVPGKEFGVFYYRYPGKSSGRIFSITEKHFVSVTGDGHRSLEELIRDDDRANCLAPLHFQVHSEKLDSTPLAGTPVVLVEIGTHCRGAVFRDGSNLITPALKESFDSISAGYEGFFFGRYDVRVESVDAFKKGYGFKIIELNGVTSEATDIYDPANSIFKAYRTLFRQWRIAFEIGAENRKLGIHPASILELIHLIRVYLLR